MTSPTLDRQPLLDRLAARARELERQVAAAQGSLIDAGAGGQGHEVEDLKDLAHERLLQTVGSAELERDLAELAEIAQARLRVLDGSYGECVACGQAIDPRRLAVQPAAARCIACQSRLEHG